MPSQYSGAIESTDIIDRCEEDPNREPHEKETAIHLMGDDPRVELTSFKRVIYEKLLQRPEFSVKRLHVSDENQREHPIESPAEILANPAFTIIGATGTLPVGALTIGTPRKSDSHAQLVKI